MHKTRDALHLGSLSRACTLARQDPNGFGKQGFYGGDACLQRVKYMAGREIWKPCCQGWEVQRKRPKYQGPDLPYGRSGP
jgi:hypothetical protein